MIDCTYSLIMDGITRASAMTLSDAIIFMKALFNEYPDDADDFQITIKRIPVETRRELKVQSDDRDSILTLSSDNIIFC